MLMKFLVPFVLAFCVWMSTVSGVFARTPVPSPLIATQSATMSAEASQSAVIVATNSGLRIQNSDITSTQSEDTTTLLARFKARERVGLGPLTFIRYTVQTAVDRGVPINTIVFLFLFPVVSSIIAIARHIIGLTGFSIYAPAALALTFISLGLVQGAVLFIAVLVCASVGKKILPFLKLPYMPRTALLLWFVSLGMFLVLVASTYINLFSLSTLSVFALLILILLSEDFMEIQSARTGAIAIQRAAETFVLGFVCALILGSALVQAAVLYYPEIILISIATINIVVGKFVGLRFTEWLRFRPLMEIEE